jgi:amidophosphoribosyltransferase
MIEATQQPRERLCTACFTGDYPIRIPESAQLGRHAVDTLPGFGADDAEIAAAATRPAGVPAGGRGSRDADGVSTGLGGGASDALSRP